MRNAPSPRSRWGNFLREAVVDYDTEQVTRLHIDSHDRTARLQLAGDRPFVNLCAGRVGCSSESGGWPERGRMSLPLLVHHWAEVR